MLNNKKIIVALDYHDVNDVMRFIDNIDPNLCRMKIGKELFTKYGPKIVFDIQKKGFDIFLDLKFHDIPTTVYKACLSALSLDIWMLNIHLSGGLDMALHASKAKQDSQSSCILLGVTALTSLSDDDCFSIYGCNREDQLKRLKVIGLESGLDGFVCSPFDINILDDSNMIFVTPGIRVEKNIDDHHRVVSPKEALELGSDYLVLGRSITASNKPNETLRKLVSEL